MGNLGTPELLVIFVVALVVLGPDKLPDAARQMGKVFRQMKSMSSGFQQEMKRAMDEPTSTESQRAEVAEKLSAGATDGTATDAATAGDDGSSADAETEPPTTDA